MQIGSFNDSHSFAQVAEVIEAREGNGAGGGAAIIGSGGGNSAAVSRRPDVPAGKRAGNFEQIVR
jgi:hypothetical protein